MTCWWFFGSTHTSCTSPCIPLNPPTTAKLFPPSSLRIIADVRLVDDVRVRRIDDQVREVERAPHHPLALVALVHVLPPSFETIESRHPSTRPRVDALRIGRRQRHGDPSVRLLREPGVLRWGDLRPRRAAVGRSEEPAARRSSGPSPPDRNVHPLPPEVPERGEEHVGILRIGDRGCRNPSTRSVPRATSDHVLPPSVVLVEAALLRIAPQLAGHAREHRVARSRVDQDFRDPLGLFGSPTFVHVSPPSVGFVDAVADRHAVARPRLARADPDVRRIRRIDRDGADRLHRLVVEHGSERRAAVGRLPHAAGRRADEERDLSRWLVPRRERRDPATRLRGADVPCLDAGDHSGVERHVRRERHPQQTEANHFATGKWKRASSTVGLAPAFSIRSFARSASPPPFGPNSIRSGKYTSAIFS